VGRRLKFKKVNETDYKRLEDVMGFLDWFKKRGKRKEIAADEASAIVRTQEENTVY